MLATIDFGSHLTWAIFIAWVMSVVLHELGHGIVGYLGGDYTIRERGGLTLNPLQYIDPVFSLLIPVVLFLLGGVPLPGGVTYIRQDLLRSRLWQSAVSAAGPAVNFIIFLACALPMHPKIGWIHPAPVNGQWSILLLFLGAFAWLQLLAVFFNLVPVPSLDGFGIVSPFMDATSRQSLTKPEVRQAIFFIWFMLIWQVPAIRGAFHVAVVRTMIALGYDKYTLSFFARAFDAALFGRAM